jgi:hypothetical protein
MFVKQLNSTHAAIRPMIARRLWIACEDSEERVKTIATEYVHRSETTFVYVDQTIDVVCAIQ